ncbi:MAG: endonuclease III [Eggerthellaceae bacterium]|nr:endonuclease III [Eggerthellaceae bacterium]
MPRESIESKRMRGAQIEERMYEYYGPGEASLDYETPFQLAIAVILSAQCTDAAVNEVTPVLFAKYGTPEALAQAERAEIEDIIHRLGFFNAKTKNIIAMAQKVVSDYEGILPDEMEALQTLPGGGRKTANCIMCEAYKNPQGIAVDTHVFRIAHRLKLAGPSADTPQKVEDILLEVYPQDQWGYINHQWIHFGREYCRAKNPRCADCIIGDLCPTRGMWETPKKPKKKKEDKKEQK